MVLRGTLVCDSVPATHREALKNSETRPVDPTCEDRIGASGWTWRGKCFREVEGDTGRAPEPWGVRGGWFRDQGKVYTWAQPGPHLGCYWHFWLNGEEKGHPPLAGVNSGEMSSLKPGERSFSPIISWYLCTFETLPPFFFPSVDSLSLFFFFFPLFPLCIYFTYVYFIVVKVHIRWNPTS